MINPGSRRVLEKCGFAYQGAGLVELPARGGLYPADHFRLDRRAWESLKTWGHTGLVREPVSLEVEVDRGMSPRQLRTASAPERSFGSASFVIALLPHDHRRREHFLTARAGSAFAKNAPVP